MSRVKIRNKLNQAIPASIFDSKGKLVSFNFGPKEIKEVDREVLTPATQALIGKFLEITEEVKVSKPSLKKGVEVSEAGDK